MIKKTVSQRKYRSIKKKKVQQQQQQKTKSQREEIEKRITLDQPVDLSMEIEVNRKRKFKENADVGNKFSTSKRA